MRHLKKNLLNLITWISFLACLCAVSGSGIFLIKNFEALATVPCNRLGFIVQDITIIGRKFCPRDDIEALLSSIYFKPIFFVDIDALRRNLEKIDWVQSVTIKRIFPGKILIMIVERKPFAYWRNQERDTLIDSLGTSLRCDEIIKGLPIVVGYNADTHASEIIKTALKFPSLSPQISSYIFVRKRRWNLILNKHVTIKLPESEIKKAFHRLDKFLKDHDISHFSSIDLRIPKQIIIKGSPQKEGDPV